MYAQANGYVENLKIVQNGTVEVADSIYQQMVITAVNSIKEFNKLPKVWRRELKKLDRKLARL